MSLPAGVAEQSKVANFGFEHAQQAEALHDELTACITNLVGLVCAAPDTHAQIKDFSVLHFRR